MEDILNHAITNNLTVQELSSYLLSNKDYDTNAVKEILNKYIEYLTISANTINTHFK